MPSEPYVRYRRCTGVVTGEFADSITAIALPTTSGSSTPAIQDWVTCAVGNGFRTGTHPPACAVGNGFRTGR